MKRTIEISGLEARFYDQFILIGTLGLYQVLLNRVIRDMGIRKNDRILDLGAGTGKNARIMNRYLHSGTVTGVEIGDEMARIFKKKNAKYSNISLVKTRIDEPLDFSERFSLVVIFLVIHGLSQDKRETVLDNGFRALQPGGRLCIFDWSRFELEKAGSLLRFFMKRIECPPALDFIQRDFNKSLYEAGFTGIEEKYYVRGKMRLLCGVKEETRDEA